MARYIPVWKPASCTTSQCWYEGFWPLTMCKADEVVIVTPSLDVSVRSPVLHYFYSIFQNSSISSGFYFCQKIKFSCPIVVEKWTTIFSSWIVSSKFRIISGCYQKSTCCLLLIFNDLNEVYFHTITNDALISRHLGPGGARGGRAPPRIEIL